MAVSIQLQHQVSGCIHPVLSLQSVAILIQVIPSVRGHMHLVITLSQWLYASSIILAVREVMPAVPGAVVFCMELTNTFFFFIQTFLCNHHHLKSAPRRTVIVCLSVNDRTPVVASHKMAVSWETRGKSRHVPRDALSLGQIMTRI